MTFLRLCNSSGFHLQVPGVADALELADIRHIISAPLTQRRGTSFSVDVGQRLLFIPGILSQFTSVGFSIGIDSLQHGDLVLLSPEKEGEKGLESTTEQALCNRKEA